MSNGNPTLPFIICHSSFFSHWRFVISHFLIMGIHAIFNSMNWSLVPFHFWSLVFFALGCIVGSFLNVCIYRMPLGLSVVTPPSHCPHCKYAIPFYLNVPLVTWLWLGGKCKNCGAKISPRYFIVELVTGAAFLGC